MFIGMLNPSHPKQRPNKKVLQAPALAQWAPALAVIAAPATAPAAPAHDSLGDIGLSSTYVVMLDDRRIP